MSNPPATSPSLRGYALRDARKRFARLSGRRLQRSRMGPARLTAAALAAAVHALTLVIMAAAVVIVVSWHASVLGWLVGGVLAAIAVWSRPRMERLPKGTEAITRAQAPVLFEVADRVAAAVGTAPLARIYLHDRLFGCRHLSIGLRREPAMLIGLPLLLVLSPRERTGMLATGLAQGVSGDPARGLLVRSALGTVGEWRRVLLGMHVERYAIPTDPVMMAAFTRHLPQERVASQVVGKVTGWVLGWPLFLAELALTRLVSAQSQLAGYYADQVAADAVSTRAVVEYLDALTMWESRLTPILSAARRGETLDRIRVAVLGRDTAADRDLVAAQRETSLAQRTWHDLEPPVALRAALLEAAEVAEGAVGLGPDYSDRVDAELARQLARVLRELSQIT